MKRSALFRIILWSIVIAILSTAMVGIGFGISFNRRRPSAQEALAVTTPPEAFIAPYGANAIVISNGLNVRKSPSAEAEVVGHFEKRDAITVERVESVNGWEWAYVTEPVTGWVMRKYLTLSDSENVQETVYPNLDVDLSDGKDTFPASSIRELEIEWAAGDILIQPHDTDQITVKEDGVTEDKYAMVLNWAGDTLKIRYCNEILGHGFGISFGKELNKDLTIYVPQDWVCDSLEIDAASAAVEVNDLTIREVNFDGASGACEFENCTVEEIDIDTASGDIRFVGSLNMLDCDAASASVYAVLTNIPSRLNMDTMSGNLDLTLPKDAGFTLHMDSMSGDFTSQFQTKVVNGNQVSGDGACRINISALSGDVAIYKGE